MSEGAIRATADPWNSLGNSLSTEDAAQLDHAPERAWNERDRKKSGGRSGRRAAGREEAFGTDDDDNAGPFRERGANKTRLKFKRRQRTNEQLAVGDELDDALMVGLVGVFVDAMVQRGRTGEKLQREIQAEHQRAGENLSLDSQSYDNW